MKQYYNYLALLIFCLLCSCECDKYKCPAFSNSDATIWLPTQSRIFKSQSTTQELNFIASTRTISDAYGEDETTLSFSCTQNDCFATANYKAKAFVATGSDSIALQIDMKSTFEEKELLSTMLTYTIGDMTASFSVRPAMSFAHGSEDADWYADSIKNINTGTSILPDIMIQTRKVANAYAIEKTYWSAQYGLIGFAFKNGAQYWVK